MATRRPLPPGIRRRVTTDGLETFQVRWYDSNGKRHAATFDTISEAEAFRHEQLRERRLGGSADPTGGATRYADWWATWEQSRTVRRTTRDRDRSYAKNHILPTWGDVKLRDIRRTQIAKWVGDLTRQGLAPATANKLLQQLSASLKDAVNEGLISQNPAAGLRGVEKQETEARFLTPEELLAVEDAILHPEGNVTPERLEAGVWWSLIVPFVADTGLRIGEVAALRVRHVDPLRGTVKVEMTATYGSTGGNTTYRMENAPKTVAGRRTVPTLTTEVGERVANMITTRKLGTDDLLWTGPRGGPFNPNNWRSRVWNPAVKQAGLEEPFPTPHALRHTAVAHWIAAGIEPYKIARYAGHRSTSTIERIYGHLLPQDADAARDALSRIRAAAQPPQPGTVRKIRTNNR